MIRNIVTLLSSGMLASFITFSLLPLVSQFITPSEMGVFQLFLSIVVLLSSIGSLKYDMTIITAENSSREYLAITSSVIILFIFTLFSALIAFILYLYPEVFSFSKESKYLILLVPVGVLFTGLYLISNQILIKHEKYKIVGLIKILQSVLNQGGIIVVGFYKFGVLGIVISYIFSQLQALLFSIKQINISLKNAEYNDLKVYIASNIKFFKYSTPSTFLNILSLHLPVFILSQSLDAYWIGIYMMANRLVEVPFNILSSSINPVIYKEFSKIKNQEKSDLLIVVFKFLISLFALSILLYIAAWSISDYFVDTFLDPKWSEVSKVILIFTAFKCFQLITSPLASVLVIIDRQEFGLLFIVVSLLVRFVSIVIFNDDFYYALISFTASCIVFYLLYLLMIIILVSKYDKKFKKFS